MKESPKEQRHDVPARSPKQTGKRIRLSQSKNHIQTVIFSGETRQANRPFENSFKRKKNENPAGAQAFFREILTFFEFFSAGWEDFLSFLAQANVSLHFSLAEGGLFFGFWSVLQRLSDGFSGLWEKGMG